MVIKLLANGADLSLINKSQQSPFNLALERGNQEIADFLKLKLEVKQQAIYIAQLENQLQTKQVTMQKIEERVDAMKLFIADPDDDKTRSNYSPSFHNNY